MEPAIVIGAHHSASSSDTGKGTHTGPYFGRPATGKTFCVIGTDVYLIRDGKVYGRWGNEDALGMFQQLGWIPSGGPPED